jgi:hypothetical protein
MAEWSKKKREQLVFALLARASIETGDGLVGGEAVRSQGT